MSPNKVAKSLLVCGSLMASVLWLASGSSSQSVKPAVETGKANSVASRAEDYVGSEACKDCHEESVQGVPQHTSHSQLVKKRVGRER